MVDDESGRRSQRVRTEAAQVAVARQHEQVHLGRRGNHLALHAPVPLLEGDLATGLVSGGTEKILPRLGSQFSHPCGRIRTRTARPTEQPG